LSAVHYYLLLFLSPEESTLRFFPFPRSWRFLINS
jgi:hypothetical protein